MEEEKKGTYRLWYEWLQTTDRSTWADEVRIDFGECTEPFDDWWDNHKQLFLAPTPFSLVVINSEDDYRFWSDKSDPDGELVVFFNLREPKHKLLAAFEELLRNSDVHAGKRGRPEHDDWADKYPLHRAVSVSMNLRLEKILRILKERQGNPDTPLWKLMATENKIDTRHIDVERCKSLTAQASRYLRWAKQIQDGVTQGVFPADFR